MARASIVLPVEVLRPRAELLTIGTELLTGSVVNTNAAFLAQELTQLGFRVHAQTACPDEQPAIQEALRHALRRSDLIVVSGGLGPTPDDLTREAVAEFFGVPLVFSKKQYRQIQLHYRKRGRKPPKIVRREALFPANAKPVFNRFGIALSFVIEEGNHLIVVVPGVPGELTCLYKSHLKNLLKRKFPSARRFASLTVKTIGLSEPTVMNCLSSRFFKLGDFAFGSYPEAGEVSLRISADSPALIRRLKAWVGRTLKHDTYSFSDKPIEEVLGELFRKRRWTLSLAESCTGGRIAGRLTRVPGASRYFRGGVVAYDDRVKREGLGVPKEVLREKGAVSRETALAMAEGARLRFKTAVGLSVTGIAGPTGGTRTKPVGLVFIGVAGAGRKKVWKEFFLGEREQIQERAAKKALEYLWRWAKR